jgi:hypothetical protein
MIIGITSDYKLVNSNSIVDPRSSGLSSYVELEKSKSDAVK